MTIRERVNWLLRMSLMLFILASVAFLSALTTMRYAVQGREVDVPDVTGKPASEAQKLLVARGIGMKVEDRVYNPLPVDAVIRQSPPPKTTVKKGQFAHVVLSLGPRKETVPQLDNRSVRAAKVELLETGMQVGEISSLYLPDTADELVLQQDPPPGTTDAATPHENFLVSLGPRPATYVMPDLVGLTLSEAMAKLNGAGLKVAKIASSAVPGSQSNVVVAETPGRGHPVDANTAITLQVAQ